MRRLALDFRRAPPPSPWGWLVLFGGLAGLGGVLHAYSETVRQTRAHLLAIQHIEVRLPGASLIAAPASEAPLLKARQTVADGRQPWNELFASLEAADNSDVAVLAVTPDPARGQLKIHAEARNLAAMLAYHRRLETGGMLRQVALLEHDIATETREAPVRFHIVASWGNEHARRP